MYMQGDLQKKYVYERHVRKWFTKKNYMKRDLQKKPMTWEETYKRDLWHEKKPSSQISPTREICEPCSEPTKEACVCEKRPTKETCYMKRVMRAMLRAESWSTTYSALKEAYKRDLCTEKETYKRDVLHEKRPASHAQSWELVDDIFGYKQQWGGPGLSAYLKIKYSRHVSMSHVTCDAYTHIHTRTHTHTLTHTHTRTHSHVTCWRGKSHVNESCHMWMSHVTWSASSSSGVLLACLRTW